MHERGASDAIFKSNSIEKVHVKLPHRSRIQIDALAKAEVRIKPLELFNALATHDARAAYHQCPMKHQTSRKSPSRVKTLTEVGERGRFLKVLLFALQLGR